MLIKIIRNSILLSCILFADNIDIGFKSYHFNKDKWENKYYNENNIGILYNFDNGLGIGYIDKNSINEKSYIIKYSKNINNYVLFGGGINYGNYNKKFYYDKYKTVYFYNDKTLATPQDYDYMIKNYKITSYRYFSKRDYIAFLSIELKYNIFKLSIMPDILDNKHLLYFGLNFEY